MKMIDHTIFKETKQTISIHFSDWVKHKTFTPKNGAWKAGHFLFGSVLSSQIDLDRGKMFKLVRKLHSKSIKINSAFSNGRRKNGLFPSNLLKSQWFSVNTDKERIQTITYGLFMTSINQAMTLKPGSFVWARWPAMEMWMPSWQQR